jgi:hypothetical protein
VRKPFSKLPTVTSLAFLMTASVATSQVPDQSQDASKSIEKLGAIILPREPVFDGFAARFVVNTTIPQMSRSDAEIVVRKVPRPPNMTDAEKETYILQEIEPLLESSSAAAKAPMDLQCVVTPKHRFFFVRRRGVDYSPWEFEYGGGIVETGEGSLFVEVQCPARNIRIYRGECPILMPEILDGVGLSSESKTLLSSAKKNISPGELVMECLLSGASGSISMEKWDVTFRSQPHMAVFSAIHTENEGLSIALQYAIDSDRMVEHITMPSYQKTYIGSGTVSAPDSGLRMFEKYSVETFVNSNGTRILKEYIYVGSCELNRVSFDESSGDPSATFEVWGLGPLLSSGGDVRNFLDFLINRGCEIDKGGENLPLFKREN